MAVLDLTEGNITIEHIEGFLYGIQEIENLILSSQAAVFEYSITEIALKAEQTNLDLVVDTILNRLQYNTEITSQIAYNFKSNIKIIDLKPWKTSILDILNTWFIDKHLSTNFIKASSIKYMNQFDDWTNEQKMHYLKNNAESEKQASSRIANIQITTNTFIAMIEVLMDFDLQVFKIDLSKTKEQQNEYPRSMDLYWGMNYELILFQNLNKSFLLHFGQVLT